jgi:hypothetical protein
MSIPFLNEAGCDDGRDIDKVTLAEPWRSAYDGFPLFAEEIKPARREVNSAALIGLHSVLSSQNCCSCRLLNGPDAGSGVARLESNRGCAVSLPFLSGQRTNPLASSASPGFDEFAA